MILLGLGTEMLAQLMRSDPRGPNTEWLLAGPTDLAVGPPQSSAQDPLIEDWRLAAE